MTLLVTVIQGRGWTSTEIRPGRGVKQGDPLSPLIFNMVIDRVLRALPDSIGCPIGTRRTNALAFADDLVLCAQTPAGLQRLLDVVSEELKKYGLTLNPAKCLTVGIVGLGREKKTAVDPSTYKIGSQVIPALDRAATWRYLGLQFSPDGCCKIRPDEELEPMLQRVTKAPLKPQQRMHVLRAYALPRLYHKLALGKVHVGCLKKVDRVVRHYVRRWLNLPHDVPAAYFHAGVADGGLGVPSMRYQAPVLRLLRLRNIALPVFQEAQADIFIAKEMDVALRRLTPLGDLPKTSEGVARFWKERLVAAVDGHGLREAHRVPQAHRWVREPTRLLSGRDYIQCVRTRINALPVRSRTTRGRPTEDRQCRAGCRVPETLDHVVQQCGRTHAARIARHDAITKYLSRSLSSRGFEVSVEPRYHTTEGVRKPDLVAVKEGRLLVLDAQVVTDAGGLNEAHERKKAYYNTRAMREALQRSHQQQSTEVLTATLSWRGVWSQASAAGLEREEILRRTELALLSTRVLIGSCAGFRQYTTSTAVGARRGIG